jgi:peptidoglycan hydrolase-like protein with peptidoglycan-binding domain
MKRICFAFFAMLLLSPVAARADQTTATVQQVLKDQGFYYGDVSGQKNADTTAAIRRYQIRNGLQITGAIDAETLRSLGVGNSGGAAPAPPPEAVATPAESFSDEDNVGQSAEISPERAPSNEAPAPAPDGDYAPGPRGSQPEVSGVFVGTPTAFEQVYGAPYLARMIFAEVGAAPEGDLYLRVEYDGAIAAEGGVKRAGFCAISGTARATELMEELLQRDHDPKATLHGAMKVALDAWSIGSMPPADDLPSGLPGRPALLAYRQEKLVSATLEACVLERSAATSIRYRQLAGDELQALSA